MRDNRSKVQQNLLEAAMRKLIPSTPAPKFRRKFLPLAIAAICSQWSRFQ